MPTEKSFLVTVPGILTGIAAIITAVGGVLAIYYNVHPHSSPTPSTKAKGANPPQRVALSGKDSPGKGTGSTNNCSPTFPEIGEMPGRRVLYFNADESARGAEVYLDGRCQGYLATQSSGKLRDNMLVNVPPGNHEVALRKKGYQDFRSTITVPASAMPLPSTSKVVVQVTLVPSPP